MLIMENQDVNPLDENFQPKDLTKTSDRYVMELGASHYDKVGNKSRITSWRYNHNKQMWLMIRESGHIEYYSKESQFESWTKTDLKNLLRALYHDSDLINTVIWPPTDKEKAIPAAPKFPKGVLKKFKFWAYDPKMGDSVIVTEECAYRLADTLDQISFHEKDIKVLNENQIRTNEQYQVCAKSWTGAMVNMIGSRLYVDAIPLYGGGESGGTLS
ncbi:hypothetical protein Hanom_Chr11g00993021 [Helianthus anomalus]